MAQKLTKKDHFNALLALAEAQGNQTLVDFINHELELLSKRRAGRRWRTQREWCKKKSFLRLSPLRPHRFLNFRKPMRNWQEFPIRRFRLLLRQLIIDNKVVRTKDKKKALFALIGWAKRGEETLPNFSKDSQLTNRLGRGIISYNQKGADTMEKQIEKLMST